MKKTKRVPLLATTSKTSKATQTRSWELRRIINLCLVGLGVCGLLYVGVLQLALRIKPKVSYVLSTEQTMSLADTPVPQLPPTGLYALGVVEDIDGVPRNLAEFSGNVSVVVNVASHCGFTETNYRGLQDLYERYRSDGFAVLAFPCNQFGNQEPDECSEIKAFVEAKYRITFPMFSKVDVNGPNTHAVFSFLKSHLSRREGQKAAMDFDLPWNFQKFVVDRDGMPRYLFPREFDREKLEPAIISLLHSEQ